MRQLGPVLLLVLLGGTSCVKDVILDAEETPQVVVACILSDDPVQELRLSFTKGASRKEAPPLTEAEAVLTDLTVPEEVGSFSRSEDGVWRLDYAAKPGHRYRLDVTVPGYDPLWAEDTMPGKLRFYLQTKYWLEDKVESPTGYRFLNNAYPEDIPFVTWIWEDGADLPMGETYLGVAAMNDPVWIYAMNYNPVTGRREIAEEICTEYGGVDDFNLTGKTYCPPQWDEPIPYSIRPECCSLLADTHIKALYPWLEGCPMHKYYLRLYPRKIELEPVFEGLAFGVSGSFSGKYNNPYNFMYTYYHGGSGYVYDLADDEGYLVCIATSEVLDTYLKDAWKMQEIQASTDLSTIYLRDNLHSNIRGEAIGIFCCKVERKYQWSLEGTYIDYDRSRESKTYQNMPIYIPEEEWNELTN